MVHGRRGSPEARVEQEGRLVGQGLAEARSLAHAKVEHGQLRLVRQQASRHHGCGGALRKESTLQVSESCLG